MSERKVLNKYIPPNFDPSLIPRRHAQSKQHTVRLMAPFSMRCSTCHEYIYKGRKFNARKENANQDYLGIRIFRFYIRCPQCGAEITYLTDPKNADYKCEGGATRNFEPWREDKEEEERKRLLRQLDETHNPMKALEQKSYDAKRELEINESLHELRVVNTKREKIDVDEVFERIATEEREAKEKEEDDRLVREAFGGVADDDRPEERELSTTERKELVKELIKGSFAEPTTVKKQSFSLSGIVLKRK